MGLSEKTMQYETTKDDNLSSRLVGRGGMHDVSDIYIKKRAARCTSIPRSRRVRGRAAPQGVNCRQPNLTLLVADSTARTRDLLV